MKKIFKRFKIVLETIAFLPVILLMAWMVILAAGPFQSGEMVWFYMEGKYQDFKEA